jgi:hypothetical protein
LAPKTCESSKHKNKMSSANKHEKMKGGKPKMGLSALGEAEAATLEACAEVVTHPDRFTIFRVVEVRGIAKKGAQDFVILAQRADGRGEPIPIFVPSVFLTKRGALLMPEMGVEGAMLLTRARHVERTRQVFIGRGAYAPRTGIEVDFIVAGAMVVADRERELPPTVVRAGGGGA